MLIAFFAKPTSTLDTTSRPSPTRSYDEALARYHQIAQSEESDGRLNPVCHSKLLAHDGRTKQVVVFFHGFTTCPQQFVRLGQQFFERGYNVFIPRMPHHGELDRQKNSLAALTSGELIEYGHDSVDIAAGLGDELTIFGLSGGGTVAAWLAQNRADVSLAAAASPFLGTVHVPAFFTRALTNIGYALPPIEFGPDAASADATGKYAPYAYVNNNTRAVIAFLHVAGITLDQANQSRPAASRTLMIVNDMDDTVNLDLIRQLREQWKRSAFQSYAEYHFGATYGLPHDIVGPDRVDQQVELVYPILIQLLTSRDAEGRGAR